MQAEGVATIDIAEGSDHKSRVEIPAAVGGARVVEGENGGRTMDDTGQQSLLAINIRCTIGLVVGTLDCVPRVQGSILHLFCNFFLH
jgi:hypothetical protein